MLEGEGLMESQHQVPKANQVKLFFVTLGTMLVAIGTPIAVSQAFESSAELGAVISIIFGSAIVLGVRRIISLSRTPGAKLFERSSHALLTICLTGGFLLTITGSFVATINQHAHVHPAINNGSGSYGETVTYTPSNWGYVGLGIVAVAFLLVFGALAFIPSTERELRRRIDLEASSVAMGTSILFFFMYDGMSFVTHLPKFSTPIAILTLIATYLLARSALAIRYR